VAAAVISVERRIKAEVAAAAVVVAAEPQVSTQELQ
jgi:hypothetical protein